MAVREPPHSRSVIFSNLNSWCITEAAIIISLTRMNTAIDPQSSTTGCSGRARGRVSESDVCRERSGTCDDCVILSFLAASLLTPAVARSNSHLNKSPVDMTIKAVVQSERISRSHFHFRESDSPTAGKQSYVRLLVCLRMILFQIIKTKQ